VPAEPYLLSLFNLIYRISSNTGRKSERCNRVQASAGSQPDSAQKAGARARMRSNRELVVRIVRDAMLLSEVLSGSYKFKALALDREGDKFAVLMDIPAPLQGGTARQVAVESLVMRLAKIRHGIIVTAIYWRSTERPGALAQTHASGATRVNSAGRRVAARPKDEEQSNLSPTNFGEVS
jgi:hypothetical protein